MTTEPTNPLTPEQHFRQYQAIALVYGFNEMAKSAADLGEKSFYREMRAAAEAEARDAGVTLDVHNDWPTLVTLHSQPHIKFDERDIELMRKSVARHDEVRGFVALPRDLVVSLMLDSEHLPEPKRTERVIALNNALESVPAPTEPMVTVPRKAVEAAVALIGKAYDIESDSENNEECVDVYLKLRSAIGEP